MNFGENFQSWFATQVGAVFLVAIGALAIFFLVRREFSRFVGFAIFAMIVGVFVFAPENVLRLGENLWAILFGG
jgi:hypothetical protein